MATVTLHITQELIDTAREHQVTRKNALGVNYNAILHCVTARAVTLALGCPVDMFTSYFTIQLSASQRQRYVLPRVLKRIQVAFDDGKKVKPQTVKILLREFKP